jgi:hypothetical protein
MTRAMGSLQKVRTRETMASDAVLCNSDLVAIVLRYADLDPVSFVQMGLVNHAWREACQGDSGLLMRAAACRPYMTKRALMGLTGLTSNEANTLPRELKQRVHSHGGGVMWTYSHDVAHAALVVVGGMEGRRLRLEHRAMAPTSTWRSMGGRGYDCRPIHHRVCPRGREWSSVADPSTPPLPSPSTLP